MERHYSAPDPNAATAIAWTGLLLFVFAIGLAAIIVALYLWHSRPQASDEGRTPVGYTLVLAAAGVLALSSVLEILAMFLLSARAKETVIMVATFGKLPISFAVFAYAIFRRRPSAHGQ